MTIVEALCTEFKVLPWQIEAVIRLLDEGNTLPFIARYRKEQHGSLDDQQLRSISERLTQLRNLEQRKQEISDSLRKLEVWTEELQKEIDAAAPRHRSAEEHHQPDHPHALHIAHGRIFVQHGGQHAGDEQLNHAAAKLDRQLPGNPPCIRLYVFPEEPHSASPPFT